jgi:oligopeptidase A
MNSQIKLNIDSSLPNFADFDVDNILQSLNTILNNNKRAIEKLLKAPNPSVATLILPLEKLNDHLGRFWSVVSHMHSVCDTKELRAVYNDCLPLLSNYHVWAAQNVELYSAIKEIYQREGDKMSVAMRQSLKNEIRDFKLSGVALDTKDRKKFAKISETLSVLSAKYEQNVLDSTQAWTLNCADVAQLRGMPEHAIATAAATATERKQSGYLLTLDAPCFLAVMQFAESRELRETVYRAYVTRSSDLFFKPELDNSSTIVSILQQRHKLATLLGFANYAEYSLEPKMAKDSETVLSFLTDLAKSSMPAARSEFAELSDFAQKCGLEGKICAWDTAYYSEKLREKNYSISSEDLRPYFPLPHVLNGLFTIINKLYGVEIKEVPATLWHADAKCYAIYNSEQDLLAYCCTDFYVREGKRGGAWMDDYKSRWIDADNTLNIPVAYVTCNFNQPVGSEPALITHDDVLTLFHEFGHGLHHMLTRVDVASVSGINGVEWDAVELPSQFMENWAWQREGLDLIAKHYKTGAKLPEDLYTKMQAARNFQSAMQMLRQVEFSLFDFVLHQSDNIESAVEVQALLDEIRAQVSVTVQAEFNRFQNSFTHIFAGGYAAGYYSYKWAEVMSSDAFASFKENGIFDRATSAKFLDEILSRGGERTALDNYVAFKGREPDVNALLIENGILNE